MRLCIARTSNSLRERVRERRDMEMTKMNTTTSSDNKLKNHEEVMLPGFRFHPTDEELVGFYLRRKVEKKPISIEIIKQADIYKYDPWDLPSKMFLNLYFHLCSINFACVII